MSFLTVTYDIFLKLIKLVNKQYLVDYRYDSFFNKLFKNKEIKILNIIEMF